MAIFKERSFYLAVVLALSASLLGKYLSLLPGLRIVGAMVIALIFGMLFQLVPQVLNQARGGIGFISNKFLRAGIILLGFRLNLKALADSGVKTIGIALFVVILTIALVSLFSRWLKVEESLMLLTACGCGICGAAAVMGVSPQVKAKTTDSVLAVAVVAILGTVFTLIEVTLRAPLGLTPEQYGVMTGASLHEIAHAIVAAGAGGDVALEVGLITKLSRVLLLAPVSLIVGIYYQRRHLSADEKKAKLPIPWFMAGFLATSAMGSFLTIPKVITSNLVSLAYILLGMAMAALGMNVSFGVIIKRGGKIFLAATMASAILMVVSYCIAILFF